MSPQCGPSLARAQASAPPPRLYLCCTRRLPIRRSLHDHAEKQKFAARVDNIYFLSRIGSSLRWATQGIAPEELSTNIKHLLARLDQLEAISRQLADPDNDPA